MHDLARSAPRYGSVARLMMLFGLLAVLLMAPPRASAADPVIAAAGDISCNSTTPQTDRCHQKATSDLLVNAGLSAVLTLGDAQYQNGGFSDFMNYYDKSWGRVKSITYPSVGNHEYQTSGASGYFDYFNGVGNATGRAGDRSKGYYSFNIGTWHLISLNSSDACTIVSCSAGSAQETWLKADLAANPNYCTLAFWHHPSFNSGNGGNLSAMQPELQDLYNADADVILGGHAHHYERFAPQNPSAQLDNARGIRQFIVGTGGAFWTAIGSPKANSQVRQNSTYGVLKMTLHPGSYDWQFVPEAGGSFTDSGTTACHSPGSPPPGGGDTQKPTPPGNLSSTGGAGKIDLSWQASTDNVGVTGYKVYRGGTEVASLGTVTSYSDTGLAGGTYSYTVKAVDAAGNLSDPSNTTTATVSTPLAVFTLSPDADAAVQESAPTTNDATGNLRTDGGTGVNVESYLRFTVSGATGAVQSAKLRLNAFTNTADGPAVYRTDPGWSETALNWNNRPPATSAATDDKGAIATNTWVEYDVSQFVTGNGTYSFKLAQVSTDGVDFYSREAASLKPELVVTADTERPTAPRNLSATAAPGQVSLSWLSSSDNVGVTGYKVYRGGTEIASLLSTATSYTDTGRPPGPHSYTVRAVDAAGNLSDPSNVASATVPDTTKPTAPGSLNATAGAAKVDLSWQASTDDVGVTSYRIFRGGTEIGSVTATATSYTDTGLAAGPYSYTVRASDAAGNVSDPSNTASATVPDTTKPTAPGSLNATAGTGKVDLSWQPSTDDVGVSSYRVFRGATQIASVTATATSYTDSGLAAGSYGYTVKAVDAAGNLSDPSNTANATVADSTKPTAPGSLNASAGTGQVDLSWQASTDDVGVTGYRVFRGTTQIASVGGTTTSYTDTGLAAGPYSYTVKAVDAAGNLSDPSNTASATVGDTSKPTAPGNLTATANGPGQVDLSWQASTDDVGVTGYRVFRGTTQIASVGGTTTTYTDSGLAAGPHSYTVKAADAGGNLSDPSNTASATVADTTKPTAPGSLNASPGTGKVDLSWQPSGDDVGVTGYRVFRGTTQIASVGGSTTSYTDTGLAAGPYSYTVKAVDAAGNISDASNAAGATVPDTTKPTAPGSLSATPGGAKVDLSWQASTDDVGVTGYRIFRDGTQIDVVNGGATSYSDTTVTPGPYSYTVKAVDAAGNVSDASNSASATVSDTTKPTAPGSLNATGAPGQVDLSWHASTDNVGVTGYKVYRGGTEVASVGAATTSYSDTGLAPGTYSYEVRAVDGAGNLSDPSNAASATVPDVTKPTAPQNLRASANGPLQADLTWQASTDNVAVTGYKIYRDGTFIASTGPTTSYSDSVLLPGTYSYEVRAFDAATNLSDASNSASVTLLAPDGERPTAPGNLSATLNGPNVDLSWVASTDNVGVTGYKVYRDGALLESISPATSYSDTTATPGDHSYQVRALDGAGNLSDPSNTATVTVTDTQKPTAPGNLNATAVSPSKVNLTWQASSDNVGVTAYDIYRDSTLLESIAPATSYSDSSVTPGPYSYEVRARDAASNASDASNAALVTVNPPDTEKPTAPGNLTATAHGTSRIDLAWLASSDNAGVTGYDIYRNDTLLTSIPPGTSYSDSSVVPGVTYSYVLRAVDAATNASDPSNTASAMVDPLDGQKPTAPGNLTATLNGSNKIDLSWQASSDNVGVTGYNVYRGGALIATTGATTTYTDGPLPVGDYPYEVRALDAAGNLSDPSNTATGTVPDTQKPTAPGNLTATGNGGQIDLSWQASTDDVGVTGYRIFRGTTQIASVGPATSYSDMGLPPGTHSYTVRAVDAAGNVSDASNSASATLSDTQKPTAPKNLAASLSGSSQVSLSWQASTDNVGVTGYRVFRGTTQIGAVGGTTTTYIDTPPGPGSHQYEVHAVDAAGNVSDASNSASATVPDTTKPTAPGNLTATANGPGRIDLGWQTSTDDVGVTGYRVFRGTTQIASVGATTTSYSDTGLATGTYGYTVVAVDAAGNVSDASNTASATLSDTQKPTAPGNLAASLSGSTDVSLSWQASTDNVGVTGYRVFRGTTQIGTIGATTTTYTDSAPGAGSHQYEVRAVDAAGNVSDPSNTASATVPDTTRPTMPGNLLASVNGSQVDLSWQASTDDVGVTKYRVFRGPVRIATISGNTTSYSDTGLAPSTYKYRIQAGDAAGNVSAPSDIAIVTVSDTTKPTAPGSLNAVLNGTSQADLTWQASSDDVGVTGYKVYRDGSLIATTGATTTYSDSALAPGNYRYEVRATDAAGNSSDASNAATVTVLDTTKPAAPGNLTATGNGAGQIDLAWQPASDNVGVTGYRVFRGTTQIASVGAATTSFSDTGLASGTYSYTVNAVDAAGNVSDSSNTATATASSGQTVLTLAPEADARVQASTATTNYGTSYLRADGGTDPAVESFLRFSVSGVPAGSVKSAKLRLYVYSGTVDGPAVYKTDPSWSETALNWNNRPARTSAATDDKAAIASNSWVEYDVTSLVSGNGTYSFDLATNSTDGVDIYSRENATLRPELVISTGVPDTTKPTAPGNLGATANGPNRIDLSWLTSTDNVGVTGYNVYRGGTLLAGIGSTTSYSDTTVAPNTTYGYQVRALDAAGNISDPSNTATATTPAPPPAPTVLTIAPEADAPVRQASPTTNYGTTTPLGADFSTGTSNIESFLRFTVSGVAPGSVSSAKLRLNSTSDGTADGPAVYTTSTSWSETTINWNTRPAPTSPATDDKAAIPPNTWVEYDVTPFVTGNGTYSFRLATSSSDGVYFSSREAATLRPELVVTLR